MRNRRRRSLSVLGFALGLPLLAPVAVVLSLKTGFNPVELRASQPLIHRSDGYVGSGSCVPCHEDHHASWRGTFHRTMTQVPTPETVRGIFDGRSVAYQGHSARPSQRDGRFFLEIPEPDGGTRTAEVALCVGSRRYQQYFERVEMEDGFSFRRLPLLWHIEARRWLHLNTVFLGPDSPDWDKHRNLWNDNCVFCHTTGPRPGELFRISESTGERQFDSEVGELGIACETCHGPGAEHVAQQRAPLRRYFPSGDHSLRIVNPNKLDPERAVALCGQCHGQRTVNTTRELVRWLRDGPTFRSGERLEDHSVPIYRDTPSPSEQLPDLFRARFWADGTPRLTAYEYQGVRLSPCFQRGEMTCSSCHRMHTGDPRGMIQPELRGDQACTQCHEEIGANVRAHTKHDPDGSGSRCLSCHMPRMVYGILEVHRSHRIENPDPRRDGESGRPHACTLCHLDRSLSWSATEMTRLWGKEQPPPETRRDGAPVDYPDAIASLLAGDAVQRISYARAAGRPDSALEPRQKATVRAALTATLGDGYPSIRWMAERSLRNLEQELPLGFEPLLDDWDHTDAAQRDIFLSLFDVMAAEGPAWLDAPPGLLLNPDYSADIRAILDLLNLQADHIIDIGE